MLASDAAARAKLELGFIGARADSAHAFAAFAKACCLLGNAGSHAHASCAAAYVVRPLYAVLARALPPLSRRVGSRVAACCVEALTRHARAQLPAAHRQQRGALGAAGGEHGGRLRRRRTAALLTKRVSHTLYTGTL
jgi:hypothetical protein